MVAVEVAISGKAEPPRGQGWEASREVATDLVKGFVMEKGWNGWSEGWATVGQSPVGHYARERK